jgi:hypothetical protein
MFSVRQQKSNNNSLVNVSDTAPPEDDQRKLKNVMDF